MKLKYFLAGKGCAGHVHRVMAAGDADIGPVVFAHPIHVGHDVGIAGDIDRVAFARDHEACLGARIIVPAPVAMLEECEALTMVTRVPPRPTVPPLPKPSELDAILRQYLAEFMDAGDGDGLFLGYL